MIVRFNAMLGIQKLCGGIFFVNYSVSHSVRRLLCEFILVELSKTNLTGATNVKNIFITSSHPHDPLWAMSELLAVSFLSEML